MATLKPVPVKPTAVPKPVVPVDPTKLTGNAEQAYRGANPYADYTKGVDTGYINKIADAVKNNTGVTQAQLTDYNNRLKKWNMTDPNAPKPFDQQAFMDQMTGKINSMFDAQKQSKLADLQASRDKAVGQINLQMQNTAPEYAQKRNQSDVVSAQNVQRLRELMASSGLQSSGENVTAQTAQNNQRQGSLNSLNLQEQQQMNDYRNRIADLNNPASEQALSSSLDAEKNQALLDAFNRANDVGYQRQQDTIHNNQADAAAQAQAKQQSLDNNWRTYTYNNMSATDKAQLAQAASQFGEDKAWEMFKLKSDNATSLAQSQAQIKAYAP